MQETTLLLPRISMVEHIIFSHILFRITELKPASLTHLTMMPSRLLLSLIPRLFRLRHLEILIQRLLTLKELLKLLMHTIFL